MRNPVVADPDGVPVLVGAGPTVLVGAGVRVSVTVGAGALVPGMTINCAGVVPSREEKVMPSLLSATRAKVKVPFPETKDVTSYSTQESAAIAPLLSNAPLNKVGWVFQVTP